MAARVRRALTLTAALLAAAVLVPVSSAGRRDNGAPALPTLYVVYTLNCTFSIVDDRGNPVTSIAPGSYQIEVSTPIMFKLVVPGGPTVDRQTISMPIGRKRFAAMGNGRISIGDWRPRSSRMCATKCSIAGCTGF